MYAPYTTPLKMTIKLPSLNYATVPNSGIGRIVIAGLQNPDCIPFWWIAPGFEIHSKKKQDLIADWIASYFQFLQSNPDCNPFLGQLVMSDIFPILIGLEWCAAAKLCNVHRRN